MKKQVLILCLCLFGGIGTVSAQLKVDANGKVYVQRSSDKGYAKLNVGDDTMMTAPPENNATYGIHSYLRNPSNNTSISICGESVKLSGVSVGVYGTAEGSLLSGESYGVVGAIPIEEIGAGIAGNTEGGLMPGNYINGSYAGFFYGDTYMDGYATAAYGIYNLSDMRLKANVQSLRESEKDKGSTLDNLMGLEVIEYNLNRSRDSEETDADKNLSDKARALKKARTEERRSRRHYGLSAQELQKVYPDLVLEGQDGYLAVNYTELVPMLLRSIQELKSELDELKPSNEASKAPSRAATSEVCTPAVGKSQLYQNTPNPFTERTEIRFTVPEDAQSAFIYIFDMTGKMLRQIPVDASMQSVTINGYELSAGIYLYSLAVNGQEIDTKRMILSD